MAAPQKSDRAQKIGPPAHRQKFFPKNTKSPADAMDAELQRGEVYKPPPTPEEKRLKQSRVNKQRARNKRAREARRFNR